jgi:hypothetical protein
MSLAPYEALVELAEAERALALDGRYEELDAVLDRRAALMATLPRTPPLAARPLVELAVAIQTHAQAAMSAARNAVLDELRGAARTRTAVAGYQSSTGAQAGQVGADYRG